MALFTIQREVVNTESISTPLPLFDVRQDSVYQQLVVCPPPLLLYRPTHSTTINDVKLIV